MIATDPTPTTLVGLFATTPPNQTAIVLPEQDIHITYGQLRAQVASVTAALAGAGIRRGDRVGMAIPNGLPTIVAFLAAGEAGTAAPLNPGYKEEEFRFFLEDTNAKVLLLPAEGADEARRAAGDKVPVLTVSMDEAGNVAIAGAPSGTPPIAASIDDVALILHTSGSTGRPKRVPLSHANLSISAQNVAASYALTSSDVSLCVMPLFHVHGLVASTLATLASGGTVVVPAKFSPLSFWRIARDHGATWYSAVPTIHQLLLARVETGAPKPAGAEKLRFIRSCSASLAPQVMHDLEAAFGAPVLEAYGMTEAAHQMASNPLPPGDRKPGSVGPGARVGISIRDANGAELGVGERGEVSSTAPTSSPATRTTPKPTPRRSSASGSAPAIRASSTSRGTSPLSGRLKEMINRGGEKVSPREIDEVLMAHPAVGEAVCFGVPHKMWGEEVAAAVTLTGAATEAELLAFCKEQLAEFKRPKQIHITDTIPRTATGKIQRRIVAQAFAPPA